jgi:hypothetical protein
VYVAAGVRVSVGAVGTEGGVFVGVVVGVAVGVVGIGGGVLVGVVVGVAVGVVGHGITHQKLHFLLGSLISSHVPSSLSRITTTCHS